MRVRLGLLLLGGAGRVLVEAVPCPASIPARSSRRAHPLVVVLAEQQQAPHDVAGDLRGPLVWCSSRLGGLLSFRGHLRDVECALHDVLRTRRWEGVCPVPRFGTRAFVRRPGARGRSVLLGRRRGGFGAAVRRLLVDEQGAGPAGLGGSSWGRVRQGPASSGTHCARGPTSRIVTLTNRTPGEVDLRHGAGAGLPFQRLGCPLAVLPS
jgi:hypothetical protein